MNKKILFENVSIILKDEKKINREVVKKINYEIEGNKIVSFVSENIFENETIIKLITKEILPTSGKISFFGDYFINDFNYKLNRVNFISHDLVKKNNLSNTTVQDFLNNGLNTKNKLNSIYSKRLNFINKKLKKLTKEKAKLETEHYKNKYIDIVNEKKYIEWSKENNNWVSKFEKQYEKFNKFNIRLKEIKKEIKNIKRNTKTRCSVNSKTMMGKHEYIKINAKNKINNYNNFALEEKKEFKNRNHLSIPTPEQSKLIKANLIKESQNLIKYIQKLETPGFLLNPKYSKLFLKLQAPKGKFDLLFDELIELLMFIGTFINEKEKSYIDKRLDFIENIKNHKSAVNSDSFTKINIEINNDFKIKKKYFNRVVEEIEQKLIELIKKDKQETNSLKRKLWEFEIISLRFQKQIYKEKLYVLDKHKKIIADCSLNHSNLNQMDFYNSIIKFEITMELIDISINSWRKERNEKSILLEEDIKIETLKIEKEKIKKEISFLGITNNKIQINNEIKNAYVKQFILNSKLEKNKYENPKYFETINEKYENIKNSIQILIEEKKKIDDIFSKKSDEQELEMTYLLDEISFKTDMLQQHLSELSFSQVQRLSLVKAIMGKNEVIILQGPTNDVDPLSKTSLTNTIKTISKKHNSMIIVLTKDIKIASTFSDEIVMIERGNIVEKASSQEILVNPIHPFTKEMINNIYRLRFLENESNFIKFSGINLLHNSFTNLQFWEINDNHSIFASQKDFEKWVK